LPNNTDSTPNAKPVVKITSNLITSVTHRRCAGIWRMQHKDVKAFALGVTAQPTIDAAGQILEKVKQKVRH